MIYIRPEHVASTRPSDWATRILESADEDRIEVVAVGEAVFLACTSVNLARDLMSIGVSQLSIDYVQYPTIGRLDAIYFLLSQDNNIDFESRMSSLDSLLNSQGSQEPPTITTSKTDQPAKLALLALFKFKNLERVRIEGAGGAINQAVRVALMLTKGKLAKRPVGIEFIGMSQVLDKETPTKKTTGIDIYLKRDTTTSYTSSHIQAIQLIQSGKVV